jgi:predicted nucleotidyltransferase
VPFDVSQHTIFVTLVGSHAHGTARVHSDVDLRGVCIVPLAVRVSYRHNFEQLEGEIEGRLRSMVEPRLEQHSTARHGLDGKVEFVIYDVAKFIKLCANVNPNALEILFADEADWVHDTPLWRTLHERRHLFLSRKVQQTYLGYGMAQLKRIRSHRAWLLDPPKRKPTRSDFGLPESSTISRDDMNRIEAAIAEQLREWDVEELEMPGATRIALRERLQQFRMDTLGVTEEQLPESLWQSAARSLHLTPEMIAALTAEKRYRAALKHWHSYKAWQERRNPDRAALEAEFGYDTKHAMHLVRLMRTGLEVLETGDLNVRRPDVAELLEIRDGSYSYEALSAEADRLAERMRDAARRSALPPDVDHERLDELLVEVVQKT